MRFEGIYTPIMTPFHDDGTINWDAYAEVIEWQIESGVDGIIVGGSTGEFYALSKEERLEQFRFAKERIAGRALFMAGVNDIRVDECLEITAAARDIGAEALLVAAPPYSLPSELELATHLLKIDRVAGLPIMLYNYPGRTGVEMGEDFLDRVGQSANICAIKESSGDHSRIRLLAREYPQIQLIAGGEDQVLEFYAWGAKAWVCASANIFPRECKAFHNICAMGGDFDRGRRIMSAFLPLMHALEQGGKFLQCIKYGAELQGHPGGMVRPPLSPMKKELRREMEEIIRTARTTVNAIIDEKE
ncbi:dihydrodipicolinate synthase family protein [Pelagibius sp. Alg239-R121]|uniref:dihydrodipicolinate synthase family protein n=1 Tax=Pelagibius sp. Alg239-R121 TaxID=2993448 RepID=UPI0024A75A92|nr:dihydrodipicolinate synthase family protein [Pelagibius sp. Alg239-R121]